MISACFQQLLSNSEEDSSSMMITIILQLAYCTAMLESHSRHSTSMQVNDHDIFLKLALMWWKI
jgi:hypothetical protein